MICVPGHSTDHFEETSSLRQTFYLWSAAGKHSQRALESKAIKRCKQEVAAAGSSRRTLNPNPSRSRRVINQISLGLPFQICKSLTAAITTIQKMSNYLLLAEKAERLVLSGSLINVHNPENETSGIMHEVYITMWHVRLMAENEKPATFTWLAAKNSARVLRGLIRDSLGD